jgi:hypothetical protein
VSRPFFPKVNRHVMYYATTTRKPRPATITALAGSGSTTMSSASIVGATSISTAATASVNQRITILDGTNTEQRRVTGVSGAGPFALTVAALRYAHASSTPVRLEPTSVTLRVGHQTPISGVTWRINHQDANVWGPTA